MNNNGYEFALALFAATLALAFQGAGPVSFFAFGAENICCNVYVGQA